jgi:predicted nucleic acid-binding protein
LPVIEIIWEDEPVHQSAMGALQAVNRRQLSLVDCASFEMMRQRAINRIFTFDSQFNEQGITVIPKGLNR